MQKVNKVAKFLDTTVHTKARNETYKAHLPGQNSLLLRCSVPAVILAAWLLSVPLRIIKLQQISTVIALNSLQYFFCLRSSFDHYYCIESEHTFDDLSTLGHFNYRQRNATQ